MELAVTLSNIQHLTSAQIKIDLSANKLTCIAGKNGSGKTTIIKALRNLYLAETFKLTSAENIFNRASEITYTFDDETHQYTYDEKIKSLNCKTLVSNRLKEILEVELPLPYGQRFTFFQNISDKDPEIRRAIVLEQYSTPEDLIEFLSEIYESDKFLNLKAIEIKGTEYYCIALPENYYIREDYLSSGEYLLIFLYRKIKSRCKLIIIDEIDISLDAAAQVRLIKWLRACCTEFEINILFTTHSLAMMRMLEDDELNYISTEGDKTTIEPASYNYIKSIMFGFTGWDKYILTEDQTLRDFLDHIIKKYCRNSFFSYHIIHTGTAASVADLLQRNEIEGFLSKAENVIAVLDGDQRDLEIAQRKQTYCIPLDSVEKAIYYKHQNGGVHPKLTIEVPLKQHKRIFNDLIARQLMNRLDIFEYLCAQHKDEIEGFAENLKTFLNAKQRDLRF